MKMRALDLLLAPWAITPEMLQTMVEIYDRHAAGEGFDRKAIEAAIGKPLSNEPKPYEVVDGVAVVNIIGVLSKRMDLFSEISGGASTQRLQQELAQAVLDPDVRGIVLNVDSPGGAVDGTQSLADAVFQARDKKPIVALIDGVGASGAYWIASAASKVFIDSDTAVVGSIGVVMAHRDVSKAEEKRGVKTTEITAGKYKRIASNYAPLSDEGRQDLQDKVDATYAVFVDAVARNRATDAETVLKNMADGRTFIGQQAIKAGLVDRKSNLTALIEMLSKGMDPSAITRAIAPLEERMKVIVCGIECTTQDAVDAAIKTLTEKATADGKVIGIIEGKPAGIAEGKAVGLVEGATAERERIQAVEAQSLPGHETLIAALKQDGKTSGPEAAVAVLKAEREKQAKAGADLTADAPKPLPGSEATTGTVQEPKPEVVADKAKAHVAAQKKEGKVVSISEAVAHVRKEMGLK
jgi:signal peptide peptidase SppA